MLSSTILKRHTHSPARPTVRSVARITDCHFTSCHPKFLALLLWWRERAIDVLLGKGLLNALILQLVDLLDRVLHLLALLSHSQVQLSLQLDGLLLLVLAVLDLTIVLLELHNHFLFLKLELSYITLDLFIALSLLVCFFLVVNLPWKLTVAFLFSNSLLGQVLASFNRWEEFVSIQLLNRLRCLQMVQEALLIGHFGLVLLPV